mmetsp:Transcript_4308/g.15177  ORF Transcript_4308/g.15177 Transcript_4308/m.15177 type:complete len:249 (+) Transcript_4308:1385-2131(+)
MHSLLSYSQMSVFAVAFGVAVFKKKAIKKSLIGGTEKLGRNSVEVPRSVHGAHRTEGRFALHPRARRHVERVAEHPGRERRGGRLPNRGATRTTRDLGTRVRIIWAPPEHVSRRASSVRSSPPGRPRIPRVRRRRVHRDARPRARERRRPRRRPERVEEILPRPRHRLRASRPPLAHRLRAVGQAGGRVLQHAREERRGRRAQRCRRPRRRVRRAEDGRPERAADPGPGGSSRPTRARDVRARDRIRA